LRLQNPARVKNILGEAETRIVVERETVRLEMNAFEIKTIRLC